MSFEVVGICAPSQLYHLILEWLERIHWCNWLPHSLVFLNIKWELWEDFIGMLWEGTAQCRWSNPHINYCNLIWKQITNFILENRENFIAKKRAIWNHPQVDFESLYKLSLNEEGRTTKKIFYFSKIFIKQKCLTQVRPHQYYFNWKNRC